MLRITTNKSVLALLLAGLATVPAGTAFASTVHSSTAKSRTFNGPTEETQYGPVQVSIVTKNKKITTVTVVNSPDSGRGMLIQGQAIPILKSETLRAQSANINEVSGATQTSDGFVGSLQSAVKTARKAKALK